MNKLKEVKILINNLDKVKGFINAINKFDNNFDIISGRYVIDAKSIMGIFCLDLCKPYHLQIFEDDENKLDSILNSIKPFIVED